MSTAPALVSSAQEQPQSGARSLANVLPLPRCTRLVTDDGASASVEEGEIVVRSPSGDPVVRYDVRVGLRIIAPDGDLTLAAPNGRVVVQAGTDVVFEGSERICVSSPSVELHSERLTTHCSDMAIESSRLAIRVTELTQLVGRMEPRAERIVETAKDVYRDVTELVQLTA